MASPSVGVYGSLSTVKMSESEDVSDGSLMKRGLQRSSGAAQCLGNTVNELVFVKNRDRKVKPKLNLMLKSEIQKTRLFVTISKQVYRRVTSFTLLGWIVIVRRQAGTTSGKQGCC
jgi:hypothetical protein